VPGTDTLTDKIINSKIVIARAKSQFVFDIWNRNLSLQYQTVRPAPVPRSAYRIQPVDCHKPIHSRRLTTSQTPALTAMYQGPGGDANSSRVSHHFMVEYKRNALHAVRLNTIHSNNVTLKGRFIAQDREAGSAQWLCHHNNQ
jgi:hypothetical protein